jgi:hypothetical protein
MTTPAPEEWKKFEQAPTARTMRMPRAMSQFEPTSNGVTVSTFHSRYPVQVAGAAATMNVALIFRAAGPMQSALEVFAGAAFDALSAATEAMQRVITNGALEKQLSSLSVDFYEDFGKALDPASISGLRHFLLAHQGVAPPKTISADSTGRIEATWEAARGQSASLKFLNDEKFHYALVVETPAGRSRPWGTAGRFEVFVARPEARSILGESTPTEILSP